jgi:hypothetical protein
MAHFSERIDCRAVVPRSELSGWQGPRSARGLGQKLAVCVCFCAIQSHFSLEWRTAPRRGLIEAKTDSRFIGLEHHYAHSATGTSARRGTPPFGVVCRWLTQDTARMGARVSRPWLARSKFGPGEAPLLACRISLLSSSELRDWRLVRARKAEAGGSVHGLIIADEAAILGERGGQRRGLRSERTLWPSLMRASFTFSLSVDSIVCYYFTCDYGLLPARDYFRDPRAGPTPAATPGPRLPF